MFKVIDVKDHPHNLCPQAKLEWSVGGRSVYSVKAGFIAFVDYSRCLDHTFPTKGDAMSAAIGGAA